MHVWCNTCLFVFVHFRISLVDLAGAKRSMKTGATGMRVKEAGNINNSLYILGRCVEAMRHNQNKRFVFSLPLSLPPSPSLSPLLSPSSSFTHPTSLFLPPFLPLLLLVFNIWLSVISQKRR